MKYVLDTNAVSAMMKGDARVLAKLAQSDRADVCIPQPVFAEIACGIARLPASKRRERLKERFALIRDEVQAAIWTDEVSTTFGMIKATLERKGTRIEDFDAAIAAHALCSKDVLVTADAKHMPRIRGLKVEDWGARSTPRCSDR